MILWPSSGERANYPVKLVMSPPEHKKHVARFTKLTAPSYIMFFHFPYPFCIARLKSNVNLGSHAEEIRFFILVLCPSDVKITKTSLETARTFATLFSDLGLRHNLMSAETQMAFKEAILVTSNEFASSQALRPDIIATSDKKTEEEIKWFQVHNLDLYINFSP